ncbi:MAG: hypothetical protein E7057_05020 [Lentisphaerae bacterium]|nr:hypothetical protein [Lentisphaerota bacterium]
MRLKYILSAVITLTAVIVSAADPMESLVSLRNAVIKNDIDSAMSFLERKYTSEMIKSSRIPKQLRDILINLTGAFEETSVRMKNPDRADIFASVKGEDGKDYTIRIVMMRQDANYLFSTFSKQPLPGAKIYLDEFLNALNHGDTDLAKSYLDEKLAGEFADGIPAALRLQAVNKVSAPENSGSDVVFPLERMGEKGTVTMTEDKLMWKISGISKNLLTDNAAMTIMPFTENCRVFAGQFEKLKQELIKNGLNDKNAGKDVDEVKTLAEAFLKAYAASDQEEIKKYTADTFANQLIEDIQHNRSNAKGSTSSIVMILFSSDSEAEICVQTVSAHYTAHNIYKAKKENEQWKIHSVIQTPDFNSKRKALIDNADFAARSEELLLALLFKSRHLIHPESFTLIAGGIEMLKNSEVFRDDDNSRTALLNKLKAMLFEELAIHFSSFAGFKRINFSVDNSDGKLVRFSTDQNSDAGLQMTMTGSEENNDIKWLISGDPQLAKLLQQIMQKLQAELQKELQPVGDVDANEQNIKARVNKADSEIDPDLE